MKKNKTAFNLLLSVKLTFEEIWKSQFKGSIFDNSQTQKNKFL